MDFFNLRSKTIKKSEPNTLNKKIDKKISKKVGPMDFFNSRSKIIKKKEPKTLKKKIDTKISMNVGPILCGSIKNRTRCNKLNRKCKFSMTTKRCQKR